MSISECDAEAPSKSAKKVKAVQLFEEAWFLRNLLHTKTSKSTSAGYSDLSQRSSSFSSSKKKLFKGDRFGSAGWVRTPLFPPPVEKQELISGKRPCSVVKKSSSFREPSPPPFITLEEDEDLECEFTLGRLIREASLHCPDVSTSPRTPKVNIERTGIPRPCSYSEKSKYCTIEQAMARKSQLDSELRQLGSDEMKRTEMKSQVAQKTPNCVDERSREDMKEKIKFWARAVASNVRHCCNVDQKYVH